MHSPTLSLHLALPSTSFTGKSQASGENLLTHLSSAVPFRDTGDELGTGDRASAPSSLSYSCLLGQRALMQSMLCHCKWMKTVYPMPRASKTYDRPVPSYLMASSPFGMNFSELLNIQKRDCPFLGPSFRNSWPNPLPHLPQETWEDHKTAM